MIKNVETSKFTREKKNRGYNCIGCYHYDDECDDICQWCKWYVKEL